jgi:glycosyltransferase involved in cell wall biosynthesis
MNSSVGKNDSGKANDSGKEPVRICFVSPKAYPLFDDEVEGVFGGAEVDLYMLGTEMAKDAGFAVSFVVADYGQADEQQIEGVSIFKSLDFAQNAISGAVSIWRVLRRADADVYVLKTASAGVPLVAWFCKMYGRAFVYRTANERECRGEFPFKNALLGWAFGASLRAAGCVFVQNVRDGENLKKTFGVDGVVVANGHRMSELEAGGHESILWVGRSAAVKGAERFVRLAERFADERFVMICQRATGDDNYNELCRKARGVKNLEFHERVLFHEVDVFFRRAKVLVNTSDSEGFPNTFIQACKAGAAILSYTVDPDGFLGEYDCGVCAGGDEERLVAELEGLLADDRYVELGENGRRYAEERHDIAKIVERYKVLFSSL